MVMDGVFNAPLPLIGSHEGAGTVTAVGSAVENFSIGDRVMAHVRRNTCGECSECLGPDVWKYCCTAPRDSLGITTDGAFAEYLVADSRWSVKLPKGFPFTVAAPLACAGATSFRAVKMAGLERGQWLAIVGSGGGLGHLSIHFAKHRGLNVIGIDARDAGLALSLRSGADHVLDARKGKDRIVNQVQSLTKGRGVDATINLSDAGSAASMSCAITRIHGTVWQVAQPRDVAVPYQELVLRDIRLRGSVICSPMDAQEMIATVAGMGGDIVAVRTYVGLESLPKLLQDVRAHDAVGKAIIVVDRAQVTQA
ncbi:hypothetical protein BAUCODRAFT_72967 [Baudoinia panamericana UAMH 10762]|uniref:Enoyl reductase (ER) domain-containing protein n=1 Tax=Baudoinia panamericana (strain UAMH 10762) TaxID=717646 RepID=M2N9N4_BAUPA|nr:uncharacterized protein BAUCODRAFT_72967 [Baudoinia panamericana UAMH 10762]EMC95505.1 hypothetical protein BAUCODRAFT_72967 [Baudoinia panamericana UAMH 10762]